MPAIQINFQVQFNGGTPALGNNHSTNRLSVNLLNVQLEIAD